MLRSNFGYGERAVRYALFLLTAGVVLFATHVRGPGLCPDSMSYLGAAESMSRGEGPLAPFADWSQHASNSRLHHFPPGFSALIAVPTALGMRSAQAARMIEALSAGALAVLSSLIVASCLSATTAAWPTLFGGAMVLITPAIVLANLIVLSEPLFLTLYALTWLLMLRAPQRVWALGLVAAACAMTRYAGVSVVLCVAVWTVARPGTPAVRLARACIVSLPTLLCVFLWRRWAGDFRHYAWHSAGLGENLAEAWTTLSDWLVPLPRSGPWRTMFTLSSLTLCALLLWAAIRRATPDDNAPVVDAAGRLRVPRAALLRSSCTAGCHVPVRRDRLTLGCRSRYPIRLAHLVASHADLLARSSDCARAPMAQLRAELAAGDRVRSRCLDGRVCAARELDARDHHARGGRLLRRTAMARVVAGALAARCR